MRRPPSRRQIPASLRTLLHTHPGDRVLVDCVLRSSPAHWCEPCIPPESVVQVRHVGAEGVVVSLPDGTDRRVAVECAGRIQVEPAGRRRSGGESVS